MKVVSCRAEFEDAYPYSKDQIPKKEYPKRYPCIMVVESCDGGLMGSQEVVHLTYPGKHDLNSFVAGFKAGLTLGVNAD